MNTEVKSAMLFRSGNIPDFSLFHLILDRHMEITRKANEISGTPPLTFSAGGTTLKNYRIYGNTVNGTSVGDEVTNSANEHYEEYCCGTDGGYREVLDTAANAGCYTPENVSRISGVFNCSSETYD